ncbi:MAG: glycosyltransferase family 2 protein [Haliea sp.]|nr:glycosyltransferase family 2 protein [Haliea sp.]
MTEPTYSLIIPIYKNEANLPALLDCVLDMSRTLEGRLEVVCVVDGSPDHCYSILKNELPNYPFPSQLLLHSRNYGSFAAIRTGMKSMRGQYMAVMAADLQEPLELAIEFFLTLERDEADVVVGARDAREDPWRTRISSHLFWWFYKKFVIPDIPEGGVDMFGCNHIFREELLALEESHGSLIGLIYWLGFRRKTVLYKRQARTHGVSAWTFRKKLNYLMDSIFAFSDLPIRMLIGLGILGMVVVLVFSALIMVLKLTGSFATPGYAATIITILGFGSLNVIGIGIVGAYVWRSYGNTMGRPLAIQMKHHSFDGTKGSESL